MKKPFQSGKHGITLRWTVDVMAIYMMAAGDYNPISASFKGPQYMARVYHSAAHNPYDTDVVRVMDATCSS
ncbi:unnamed protein product [marine sediment metagenome]|uniref:Uncharacterized protein n=1 Tax=marine sediment metagenome TaxID=412755 RepID=X0US84_9ZZZZ